MSNLKTFFASVLVAVLLFNLYGSDAREAKTCKAAVSAILKFQMKQINQCTKDLGYKGKEKMQKMNCIMKCVLVATGSLREDGSLDVAEGLKFMLRSFPLDSIEKAILGTTKCQEFASILDPAEEDCKSYEPLVKCLTNFILTVCN